jgi:hypothetical protein
MLMGDAGYSKDPITAQDITDAFRDAQTWRGRIRPALPRRSTPRRRPGPLSTYPRCRRLPLSGFTTELATLEPPPAETRQLLAATHGNQPAMDRFVGVTAGTVSPIEFFDPANTGQIFATAAQSAGR